MAPQLINDIASAAALLAAGQLVAFPTETVYGLGADATDFAACQQIYSLKGRPSFNPLIVHIASLTQAQELGVFSPLALKLAQNFWPGPVTLVVPVRAEASLAQNVIAGLPSVGLRVPAHSVALELLKLVKKPIAAPSANISNYISATSYEHVLNDFANSKLNILLPNDAEQTAYTGLESTIIDATTDNITLLRSGIISKQEIENVIGQVVCDDKSGKIKSPGMLSKHYSPKAKLRLNAFNLEACEVGVDFAGVLQAPFVLSSNGDLVEAAKNLYATLRKADQDAGKKGFSIAVAPIPEVGIGIALNDKLKRAAKQ